MAMAEKRLPRSLSGCLEPPSAEPALDPSLLVPAQMSYRSTGLGFYAIAVRCCTMPLEKLAMIMNSAQVSGQGQMRQARASPEPEPSPGPNPITRTLTLAGALDRLQGRSRHAVPDRRPRLGHRVVLPVLGDGLHLPAV